MIGTASPAWPVRISACASSHWAVAVRIACAEEPSLARARAWREAARADCGWAIIEPLARSMAVSKGDGEAGCGAATAAVADAAMRAVSNARTVRFIPLSKRGQA